jgi:acyl carrier protein
VEALLRRHDAVADAVVVVRDDTGETRLVAYWVPAGAPMDHPSTDVRAYLRERLPEYMVPSAVMRLDALPLTANGKVDRRRLPAPTREQDGFVTPDTPLERQVAAIWREVLGVPEVGATDNFFDVGGHSLMALRLVARVQQAFGVEIPVQHVFSAPTVREMAIVVDEARLAMDDEMARIDALLRLVEDLPEGTLGDLPQAGSAREQAQE